MVKKKGKSNRVTLKDKYKIERRVIETNRKRRKASKKDAKSGKVIPRQKDPGIPNSWPFKEELLREIKQTRERQAQLKEEMKSKRKTELRALAMHQSQGGTSRTVQEYLEKHQKESSQSKDQNQNDSMEDIKINKDAPKMVVEPIELSSNHFRKEFKAVIQESDILLQVLDARDPTGSRLPPALESMIENQYGKKIILVLNKVDLVPKDVVAPWLRHFRQTHPVIATVAHSASSSDGMGMDGLLQLVKAFGRTLGKKCKVKLVVGLIGYANTGKSSIINALVGSNVAEVNAKPRFTTAKQEIRLNKNILLLDSPGIILDEKFMFPGSLCSDELHDPISNLQQLISRCDPASLVIKFNIPAFPPGNVMIFLAMMSKSKRKGDKSVVARTILKEWISGHIPYYSPPPAVNVAREDDQNLHRRFGVKIEFQKYDDEVIQSLKNEDEMDFVQLHAPQEQVDEKTVVEFMNSSDEEDVCDMDCDADEMKKKSSTHVEQVSRKELEVAEDYDFNE